MRSLTVLILIVLSLSIFAKQEITFVDAEERRPVAGATVLSRTGIILGITDNGGTVEVDAHHDMPLNVRCMGFGAATITEFSDTVCLVPATYTLQEVIVVPEERPVTRILSYAREYCTGTSGHDTIQMYADYMLESFVVDGKVKGYDKSDAELKVRGAQRFARFANAAGLDTVIPLRGDNDVAMLSFIDVITSLPSHTSDMPERLQNGAYADTVQGKYGPQSILRKSNSLYMITRDMLCDHKNHQWSPWYFKLFGLTIDIKTLNTSYAYALNENGRYSIYDFIYGTYNVHALCRGKWFRKLLGFKEAFDLDSYIELYPVSIEQYTVAEYKELKKDHDAILIEIPSNCLPTAPAIESLLERACREIPQKRQ